MRHVLFAAAAVLAAAAPGETINVKNGDELAAAVKSLKSIRAANRDVPVEILLASGDYDVPAEMRLKEGRNFTSSGSAKVEIRAAPGAKPRLCGGTVVTGWQRTNFNGRDDVWVADVSALKIKAQLPLFFHDGVSMTLCRHPNADPSRPYSGGWAYVPGKPISMYKEIKGERDDEMPVKPEDWRDRACPSEGRVNIFPRYNWWNRIISVASCDPTNRIIRFTGHIRANDPNRFAPRANDRYHVMGFREDLDAPGEWYHDLAGAKVYFITPDGSDPNARRTAVLADGHPIFKLDGVTNVVVRGLEICEAAAAVTMSSADSCEVVACRIHDIGFASGNAVSVSGTRCTVRDCDIWNIGAYGISVTGGNARRYTPETRDGNLVENNYIHHTGLLNRHGFGVYIGGQGSRISHNLMHDMPRGGIFYGGRFLTIDHNRIRHVNLEMEDTAAIYGGGFVSNTGTKITDNWVSHSIGFSHDSKGVYHFRRTCAWGIYLDDCSGGATVSGNLVDHCNGGAMHMHCARFNVVSNNVFVSNGGESSNPRQFSIRGWRTTDRGHLHTYMCTSAQKAYERLIAASPAWTNYPALAYGPKEPDAPNGLIMQGNRIVNNIWYYPDQPESIVYGPGNYNVSNNVFDANVIWCGANGVKIKHEGKSVTLDEWRAKGQEIHSAFADPLFKDPANGDWSFREGSPAPALGIAPVHPERTGLYLNENRKELPVEAEGAREHPEWTCDPTNNSTAALEVRTTSAGPRWFEEMAPMKDGVRLYTYGSAPAEGVKCPIVITRTPYVKEERVDVEKWAAGQRAALERGYARLVQHCRGCGMSEGDWIPYESERADGLALLEFVRSLPWYNGEIYLEGGSYLSSVHWAYLDTNPPDVKGAALYVQDVNRYNIVYRNGFFKAGLHGGWFVGGYKKKNKSLQRDKSVTFAQFPLADFSRRYWGESVPALDNKIRHPRADDPYWHSPTPGSGAAYRNALLKSTMPILLKTGFYDIYTEGISDMWREIPPERRANCSLIIDAYDHGGRLNKNLAGTKAVFPGGARADEGVEALDWFDSIRKNTICHNAPRGAVRYYALWENAWKESAALDDGPREVHFAIGAGTRSYVYDPTRSLPNFPGSGGICFGGMQVQPPPDFRDDVASFILPPISERLDARGRMEARLAVESDCADTCFYVRVSVDKGDGKWLLLRDDIASLAYNVPYTPGTKRILAYRFADHAFRLEKGDRLRVDVASACSQFAPHPNVAGDAFAVKTPRAANNKVHAEESELILHVLK